MLGLKVFHVCKRGPCAGSNATIVQVDSIFNIFNLKNLSGNDIMKLLPVSSRGRLYVKMSFYQYREPYVKDKTVSRPSYL